MSAGSSIHPASPGFSRQEDRRMEQSKTWDSFVFGVVFVVVWYILMFTKVA